MWLIDENTAREMQLQLDAGLSADEGVKASFAEAVLAAREDGSPRNLTVAGDVAEIAVEGLLTEKPDFWAWLFGLENTTYQSIVAAVAIAEANPAVKRLQFNVNSPGGTIAGLFDALAAIDAAKKPRSVVTGFAASAAYALAAVAGKITATNAAVLVGSIGVAMSLHVDENRVDISSTEAPNKRPDVTTEEGKAVIRKELDALHELFVGEIATGRGTTVADVNANFGRGSVLVANEAKRVGMIDKVAQPPARAARASATVEDSTGGDEPPAEPIADSAAVDQPPSPAATGGGDTETERETPMDLKKFKTEHPAVFAEAVEQGRTAERDRVTAHLIRGRDNEAMPLAIECVESGAEMTQTLLAKYDGAGKNKRDLEDRKGEAAVVTDATDGAAVAPDAKDFGDKVADSMERSGTVREPGHVVME